MSSSSKMTGHKVTPSAKVNLPASDIGSYPQTSRPNPSQTNGSNPPTLRPPAVRGHASDAVRAEFGKLEPSQR
jgi:hypothetical protein